jgi:hypothetical protein
MRLTPALVPRQGRLIRFVAINIAALLTSEDLWGGGRLCLRPLAAISQILRKAGVTGETRLGRRSPQGPRLLPACEFGYGSSPRRLSRLVMPGRWPLR